MKIKTIIVCLLAFVFNELNSQINLVLNPSFEQIDSCPNSFNQIQYAKDWNNIFNDINYEGCWGQLRHTCCVNPSLCGVPNFGVSFSSYQLPKTGSSMCMLTCYTSNLTQINSEYVVGRLSHNLVNQKEYCVKININLDNISKFKTNQFGLYFYNDTSIINVNPCNPLNITPHIFNNTNRIMDDTLSWTKIDGIYSANGNEIKFVLGNFYSNQNTVAIPTFFPTNFEVALYNIDDVSVIPIDVKAWAGNDVTLCVGDTARLGRLQEVGLECLWYTTTNTTPFSYNSDVLFTATEPGTYTLIQKMDNCQISFDTVTVTVVEDCNDLLTLPNVFTPNGDGTNDVFSFSLKNGTVKTFAVYNRWGNLVAEVLEATKLTGAAWDGHTTAGEPCNDGVYFYVLEYTDAKGELKTKRGYVSLMR